MVACQHIIGDVRRNVSAFVTLPAGLAMRQVQLNFEGLRDLTAVKTGCKRFRCRLSPDPQSLTASRITASQIATVLACRQCGQGSVPHQQGWLWFIAGQRRVPS
jgi:hypothetical protein